MLSLCEGGRTWGNNSSVGMNTGGSLDCWIASGALGRRDIRSIVGAFGRQTRWGKKRGNGHIGYATARPQEREDDGMYI